MKKKIILSIAFIISLLPMFLNQYGGLKGVQEITGCLSLIHISGKVIEREISEEDHAKLIDEFIENVGEAS